MLKTIVLASASPRRAKLLDMLGVAFTVVRPDCDETITPGFPPAEIVRLLAIRKAENVAARLGSGEIIVAADTLVWLDGRPFGKPRDEDEAYTMLRALSGRAHEVFTGLAVCWSGEIKSETQMTRVFFRELSDGEIWNYIRSGIPMDKAGAYGIQDRGALFVSRIVGDFYTVMGLPLCLLGQMLENEL